MAEGDKEGSIEHQEPPTLNMSAEAFQGLIGQSKSTAEELVKFEDLSEVKDGKNKLFLVCFNCKCKIIRPGYCSLIEKERFLPSMTEKYKIGEEPKGDDLTDFWLVKDMFHFENVGFSKTINRTEQYLICADCEIGPIGWHDIQNKQEYFIAAQRVRYATK